MELLFLSFLEKLIKIFIRKQIQALTKQKTDILYQFI